MLYRVIGVMSGSSLDGLDLAFIEFEETGGKWNYDIKAAQCIPYNAAWQEQLKNAHNLSAFDYLKLHSAYGKFIGEKINEFIEQYSLHHQVQLVASHGHTVFHAPQMGMTSQLGEGAAIASVTEINVVSDLRAMDVAFGGQGAPLVPIGEKLLFADYDFCLNIGGIANITYKSVNGYIAFDVCAANRVLNLLVEKTGKTYDDEGKKAAAGKLYTPLLTRLNALSYYDKPFPKSLANSFGVEEVYPLIESFDISLEDKLRTYTEHIAMQIGYAAQKVISNSNTESKKLLITGGGGFNTFLVQRIQHALMPLSIEVIVGDEMLVNYKEALIMGLIGALRWREEYNVINTVTGATRNSIGGAVWIGQEA